MDSLDDLRAALPTLTFTDHLRHLKFAEQHASGRRLKVAVLRAYTCEPLEPVLKLRLILDGFQPVFWFGGYGQYVQELLDTSSGLYEFAPDVVLLMARLSELAPDFVEQFASRPYSEWEERLVERARELGALAETAAQRLSAQVVVQNAALASPYFGTFDAQCRDSQQQLVRAFNRELAAVAERAPGVCIWDFERLALAKGLDTLEDPKAWYVSRNPYRQSSYPLIAEDLLRYVRSTLGRLKKCVVLDLDNTLWGGVIGEDGMEGIQLGHTYPGNCYREFQRELLKLSDRGLLLAIDSKNNEADALRAIDDHPDQVLRRQHFAAMRINWEDKASNLRALARELNIGLDSLIFVDDNPVECEMVRRACPEVHVVQLPDKPYLLPAQPSSWPGVDNVRITDEDRRRGEMYRAQVERREHEGQYTNVEDFLRTLQMSVAIERASSFSVPRVAQLTQKTNQLNMTTRRYTESQIQALAADPAVDVVSVAARDRFGDHGVVGVLILRTEQDRTRIDTFLLSCRVIGRGIEQAMIACAADLARARGARRLAGEFLATPKNAPAAGIYARHGLRPVNETWFEADLRETAFPYPSHTEVATPDRRESATVRS